jgi:transposase
MGSLTLTTWQRRRLEQQLRSTHDARVYRRTLAVLEAARGEAVSVVARRLRVTPRVVYYWLADYARERVPDALRDLDRSGRPTVLTASDRDLLRGVLGRSPQEWGYPATQWTVPRLREHLAHRTGRRPSDDTVRRELRRLGYTWKRSRYTLDPDPELGGKKEAHPAADPGPAAP